MRGVTIVVAGGDAARFEAALTLANAQAALGGRVRVYLHDAAVTLPLSGALVDTARELGVVFLACQTALGTHGVRPLDWVDGSGMVGLLADLADDRLVTL